MKKRDDLKERLKALRVNEPLKLNGEMKPPVDRKEVPQKEAPPKEVAQKKDTRIEAPQSGDNKPRSNTQVEAPRFEDAHTELAQKVQGHNEAPQPAAACPEVPQNEAPHRENGAPQGFFKLSHSVFAEPLLRELSGDCFRLFLWLSSRAWRYPTSGGVVRASVGYIELHAGMSHATISRGLKALKEKGLITVLEVDFKNGNLWQVSALACGHPGNDNRPPRSKAPQNEAAQIADSGASKNESHSLKMRVQPPQNEQDLRSFKKVKKLKEVARVISVLPETQNDNCADNGEEILKSFETSLGQDEQSKLVDRFMTREYPHGFFPPMRVIRALAAREWFNNGNRMQSLAC